MEAVDPIYNDPLAYADLILNGDPEVYLKTVTEYKPLDWISTMRSKECLERFYIL